MIVPLNLLVLTLPQLQLNNNASDDYMDRFWCRYEYLLGHKNLGVCSVFDLMLMRNFYEKNDRNSMDTLLYSLRMFRTKVLSPTAEPYTVNHVGQGDNFRMWESTYNRRQVELATSSTKAALQTQLIGFPATNQDETERILKEGLTFTLDMKIRLYTPHQRALRVLLHASTQCATATVE